ncbi:MAG: transporter substrate-binding domain-containing protein [Oscillospiraceae bacterium]|nr:transporter substrate-binding domain-containing protein [Oscillospiraceae bacterium]
MKKALAFVLALLLLPGMAVGAAADRLDDILSARKIVIATCPDFAPLEFRDPTKVGQAAIVGAEVELMKYIAKRMGVELVIEEMTLTETLDAVMDGRVDMAVSGFAWTQQRADRVALSDFYSFEDKRSPNQGLLILKKNANAYKTARDFAGKQVAVQRGTLQYDLLIAQIPSAKPVIVENLNEAVQRLKSGKVDAVGVAYENGKHFVTDNPDELVMSQFIYKYSGDGNVLAMKKGEEALMTLINAILFEIQALDLLPKWCRDALALAASLGL